MQYRDRRPSLRDRATELVGQAIQAGLHQDRVAAHMCRKLSLPLYEPTPEDLAILQRLIEARKEEIGEHMFALPMPGPDDDIAPGDFSILRTVTTRQRVAFWINQCQRGFQFYADTGFGKSSVLRALAAAWTSLNHPCIVIAAKPDHFFWALARMFPNRCLILRAGKDCFYNAFFSPTGDPMDLIAVKIPYFISVYDRWDSATLFIYLIRRFLESLGITKAIAPTVSYFVKQIPNLDLPKRTVNPSLRASLLVPLSTISESALGRSMACQKGIDWAAVLRKRLIVVIECTELNDADAHFMTACILADLRKVIEIHPDLRSSNPLFVIDEAGAIISKRWDNGKHVGPFSTEVTLLRGSSIAAALGAHNIADSNPRIRANAAVTMIGGLGNAQDIDAAARSAALTHQQRDAISHLRPHTAVLKMTGERYNEPFLVTWDPPDPFADYSEHERLANNAAILASLPPIVPDIFPTHPAPIISRAGATPRPAPAAAPSPTPPPSPPHPPTAHFPTSGPGANRGTPPSASSAGLSSASNPLSTDHLLLLRDLHTRPFLNVTDRASSVSLSPGCPANYKTVKTLLDELHRLHLCEPIKVRLTPGAGSTPIFWYLTQPGWKTVGYVPQNFRGGSSPAHHFLVRLVASLLTTKRFCLEFETSLFGTTKKTDIGCVVPGIGLCAFEVCHSTFSTEPEQALKDLQAGWQRVFVVAATPTDLKRLRREFHKQFPTINARIALCCPCDLASASDFTSLFSSHCVSCYASLNTPKRR